jgi:CheY-like chemotaxis protein
MDGPTATKELRTTHHQTLPIFGVTGNGMQRDIDHFLAHGATAVFVKPFVLSVFEEKMEAWGRGK